MSRKALVTGASSGIGRAICENLLETGHQVVGLARNFSRFPCTHPDFEPWTLDLSDLEALPGHLRQLMTAHPQIDAIVCSAGQGRFGELEQFSYAQIRALMDLNFTSHAFVARTFLPLLKKAGHGDLVFIGSEAALRGTRKGAVYCASKFAVRGFAQALREESARPGVHHRPPARPCWRPPLRAANLPHCRRRSDTDNWETPGQTDPESIQPARHRRCRPSEHRVWPARMPAPMPSSPCGIEYGR